MKLDAWQQQVLKTKGNMCICSPRQMGKSTIISMDAGEYAVKNPNKTIMIIAHVERQALLLFEKVLSHIYLKHKKMIAKSKDKPTKHKLTLTNGTVIHCLPTGDSGFNIRGYTIDRLYADEAAFINEDVWAAVTPMLATTGGDIILLSTPFGTEGYFYRMFYNNKFTSIHIDPDEVIKNRKEPQKTDMIEFRKDEKERMTRLQFKQEYMGLFVGGVQRFIPDELINAICTGSVYQPSGKHDKFCGIDIARKGGDECPIVSFERIERDRLQQFEIMLPEAQTLTDTARLIIHKDAETNYKKIYMDDGGLGVGVFDMLYDDNRTKRKIVGLNNASREIERKINKGKTIIRKKTLLGEDMAVNLKVMMEKGKIQLLNTPEIRQSLRSMQFDNSEGVLKIYGNYDHIFEALKRATHCIKDKSLNIYIY